MASRSLRGDWSHRPDACFDDSLADSVAGRAFDRGGGNLGNLRPVLGDAGGVSQRHRGGGLNRAHQLDRKPRRLRGPVPGWDGQASDAQLCWRDAPDGRFAGRGRIARLDTASAVARNRCIMSDVISVLSPAALWRGLGLAHHNWPGRFTVLLLTIMLLLVTQPMFSGHDYAQNFATVAMSLVLLAALWAFRSARFYFAFALVLFVPSFGSRVALFFTSSPAIEELGAITSCLFLAVTVIALVTRLFIVTSVTLDTISAAICAYLLTAIAFAYAFAVVELQIPASFSVTLFQKSSSHNAPLMTS